MNDSPRDSFYESLCYSSSDYDSMIKMLMLVNTACKNEAWACEAIHASISIVLFGGKGDNLNGGTGGVMATRVTGDKESPNYKKVYLSLGCLSAFLPKVQDISEKAYKWYTGVR